MTDEPLVLLPGMMCDARLFSPQIERFSSGRAIHLAPLTHAETVQALARTILDNAPSHFALAGLSMGGIVAMEMLRQAPDRITRLALLDTNQRAELPGVSKRREPQIEKVRNGQLADVMRDEMKPNYLADTPQREAILDLCMDMALKLGPELFIQQSRALQSRPDQTATLKQAQVPVLVLCGREDVLCPVDRHEEMAAFIDKSDLVIVEGAGHLSTLEQPQKVNAALETWLNG